MKNLYIGDMHVTPDRASIQECEALIDYIYYLASTETVDNIVFLGDQTHTHSIVHLPVLSFWQKSFAKLSNLQEESFRPVNIIVLVGNHDRSPGSEGNSMMMFGNENVTVVSEIPLEADGITYVGYCHETKDLLKAVSHSTSKTLVCHQTFDGAIYENGFYAKDGVSPDLIPHETVISGHIHTPHNFGKINYVGSPRWRTVSDANINRNLWLVSHSDDGSIKCIDYYRTDSICKPIFHVTDSPEEPFLEPMSWEKLKNPSVVLDIHGPVDYIQARKLWFADRGYRIRTFPIRTAKLSIKESDGMPKAMSSFLEKYTAKNGTSVELLTKLVQERVSWMKSQNSFSY